MSIADIRTEYRLAALNEAEVAADPMLQFGRWFDDAVTANVNEPNAMCLATATPDAYPSARIVLLKGADAQGFVFFTDYRSRKGQELAGNPHASLCFFWPELERQVRVGGAVQRTSRAESEAYFHSRPVSSQIGAWTSHQSSVLTSRDDLERAENKTIRGMGSNTYIREALHFIQSAIKNLAALEQAAAQPPASDAALTQPREVVAWSIRQRHSEDMPWQKWRVYSNETDIAKARRMVAEGYKTIEMRPLTYADTRDAGEDAAMLDWLDANPQVFLRSGKQHIRPLIRLAMGKPIKAAPPVAGGA